MTTLRSEPAASRGFRILAAACAVLIVVLIGTGSSVRVTGSGMGCLDDWPLCHGRLLPPLEFTAIVEWLHRATTATVTWPLLAMTLLAWRRYRHDRAILLPALAAPVFLAIQIALGAIVVKLVLPPALVAIHMANAMLVLAAVSATAAAAWRPLGAPRGELGSLARWATAGAALTYAQIVLGSVMVHVGASGACAGFPQCSGEWLPAGSAQLIHMSHRALGTLAALAALAGLWQAWRAGPAARGWATWSLALVALFAVQITLGASNILYGFPRGVNVAHLTVAAALWAMQVALATGTALALRPAAETRPRAAREAAARAT
jgi:heme A synthase